MNQRFCVQTAHGSSAIEELRDLGITQLPGHLRMLASDSVEGALQKAGQGYAYVHSKDLESILAAFTETVGGNVRCRPSSLRRLPLTEENMLALVAYDKLLKIVQEAKVPEEIRAFLLEKQRASGFKPPKQTRLDVNPFSAKALAAAWTTEDWLGGSLQIVSYKGHTGPDVVVPESIGGQRVCRIGQSTFCPRYGRNKQIA